MSSNPTTPTIYVNNLMTNLIEEYYIPEELCDEIIKLTTGKHRLKFYGREKETFRGYISSPLSKLSPEIDLKYKEYLQTFLNQYIEKYPILKEFRKLAISDNNVQIQLYDEGFFYKRLHCENMHYGELNDRVLVFMTYMNTIENGGGTDFPYQNYKSTVKKGLTLLWPTYWTHPHVGIPTYETKKVIATGWFNHTWNELDIKGNYNADV